ncbi:MAG: putative Ig domain-containing protein, partial [Gaiellaceae bacterium]
LASGALPGGLSLDSSTGAVAGTPTSSGTYSFTAEVSDDASQSDTQALSITVDPAPAPPPLAITTPPTLPAATQRVSYSVALAATGGDPPYTWSRVSGSLPKGLTLSPSGVISGTPTKRGNSTFTLRVRDSAGAQVSRTFSLRVNRP